MTDQQLTDQLQRPLRDFRISVTDRCNFRCTYCMPAEIYGEAYKFLPNRELLNFEEITRVSRIMAKLGVEKLRLTGGEPLVRQHLNVLIEQLATIPGIRDIAMTTNGVFLPGKAETLKAAGLRRVTVSLDSLDNEVFRHLNGGKAHVEDVLAGIQAAQAAGLTPIKINAVVKRGANDHTIVDLARFAKDHGHILRFIEFMDVGTRNGWSYEHVVGAQEIIQRVGDALPLEPLPPKFYGETAMRYRFADGDGEIGVIASVTQPFCGSCTRLRMSPQGKLYTCLFASEGFDLRASLRAGASDAELEDQLRGLWGRRKDRYSEERTEESARERDKIEMYYIGG
ncbi:MAG: GTP 3',8-cyclase MoaA [Anaerolineales bacterium]